MTLAALEIFPLPPPQHKDPRLDEEAISVSCDHGMRSGVASKQKPVFRPSVEQVVGDTFAYTTDSVADRASQSYKSNEPTTMHDTVLRY